MSTSLQSLREFFASNGQEYAKKAGRRFLSPCVLVLSVLLGGCGQDPKTESPHVRPVRTVTVEKHEAGAPVTLTGRIEAEDEVALAFRISGRLVENDLHVGARVEPGQVIARLEPQNELNALRAAQANVGRSGATDPGQQPLRPSGSAAQAWLDDASEPRSGEAGAADRASAGRCRRGAAEERRTTRSASPRSRRMRRAS